MIHKIATGADVGFFQDFGNMTRNLLYDTGDILKAGVYGVGALPVGVIKGTKFLVHDTPIWMWNTGLPGAAKAALVGGAGYGAYRLMNGLRAPSAVPSTAGRLGAALSRIPLGVYAPGAALGLGIGAYLGLKNKQKRDEGGLPYRHEYEF